MSSDYASRRKPFAGALGRIFAKKPAGVAAFEPKLRFAGKVLKFQRSYRALLGVREIERPNHEVQDGYKRFNQKYNLTIGRPSWDSDIRDILKRGADGVKRYFESDMSGYRVFDHALDDAANTIPRSFKTNINYPNSGFLSWSGLGNPISEIRTSPTILRDIGEPDEAKMASLVKKVAIWFGASLAGIALLDRRWVYSNWYDNRSSPHRNPRIVFSDELGFEQYSKPTQLEDGTQVIPKEMKYVISLAFEMDYRSIKTAPAPISDASTRMYGYRKVIETTAMLAEFIRGLGFNAIPSSNDTALNVPIAVDAGLGEDGRMGFLVTPEYGPRVRLGKVITDLPLAPDKPVTFGVHEFCDLCMKCARFCPGKAIPSGRRTFGSEKNDVEAPTPSENVGALRWMVNHERCRAYWAAVGTNCSVCIRVCPWNKPDTSWHSFSKWFAINGGPLAKRLLIELDDLLAYGKRMRPEDWWDEPMYSAEQS